MIPKGKRRGKLMAVTTSPYLSKPTRDFASCANAAELN